MWLNARRRYMTWDKALFPEPEKMQDNIASRGRKIVTIVDPHIKRDPAYPVFKNAEDAGHYVKNKDGKDYDGCPLPRAKKATHLPRVPYTLYPTPPLYTPRCVTACQSSWRKGSPFLTRSEIFEVCRMIEVITVSSSVLPTLPPPWLGTT